MAINFNNQNGIGTLDLSQFGLMQPQNTNMQVADAYNTPTEGEYGFNLIQLDRLKNAGYDPAELSTYPNQEDVQSIIRNLEPTANANNIMTDASTGSSSSIIEDEQGNLVDTENRIQFGNEKFDSEPYEYTPDYLGANSPMLDEEGNEYGYNFTNSNDPAFGKLQSYLSGGTGYPERNPYFQKSPSYTKREYFDIGEQVPSLQRALGNKRFAMAPEQPQGIAFNNPVGGLDQYAKEMEALEAARGGQKVSVNELGGTLQDFYTNRNPGTNANTKMEVIDDNINFKLQPQNLGFIEPTAVPKEAIYQDRIMNNNLSNSNYEPKQGILQGLQDKMGGLRDFLPGGDKSLSGMAVKGIKGIGNSLSGGLGNIFQDRQLYDDTTDEYGNVYSADELNSQNALGGYYTDAARSARRRTSRIANMLSRQKAGKDIGENNLAKLQAQEKIVKQQQQDKQNKIQKAATKRTYSLQDLQNSSDRGTGQNYAAARSRTSSRVSPSGRMRAYGLKDGGLASMFTRRR